jgi:glycosyltransferase involved in cell wall biosynthesis
MVVDRADAASTDVRSPRIVLMARSLERGGAETQLVALARGLRRRALAVTVVCLYARGPLIAELIDSGVPVIAPGKRGRWDLIGFLLRLVRALRRIDPDIIHAFLGPPNVLAALAKPWVRECRLVWGIRASNMDLGQYDWSWRITSLLERLLVGRTDLIIANSRAGRDVALTGGFPDERLVVVPNGIDTDRFVPDHRRRDEIRTEWRIPKDAFLIGMVARFDPMKDHGTYLRAAAIVARSNPRIRFACIGDGPSGYIAELQDRADEFGLSGRVVWAGARGDMTDVYGALDAITLTSAYGEGFPNVVGEAMACERACVATDVGDAATIIDDTGIVTAPGDARAIADGWIKLADEAPADRAGREHRCRERIVKKYSVDRMIVSHLDAYGTILSLRGGTDPR